MNFLRNFSKKIEITNILIKKYSTSNNPGFRVSVENGIRTILIDRPDKKNAMSYEMYTGMTKGVIDGNSDSNTKMIVFKSSGDLFSSGQDLKNFNLKDGEIVGVDVIKRNRAIIEPFIGSFIDCEKPLAALVNGPAFGIWVTILGLFDLVFASDRATFQTPFTKLGISPEGCSSYTFPRIMGYARASEFLHFSKTFTAEETEAAKLVSRVFPHSIFEMEAQKKIEAYSKFPLKSIMFSKKLVRDEEERRKLHNVNKEEWDLLELSLQSEAAHRSFQSFAFGRKI